MRWILVLLALPLPAERIVVPLRDPSRPAHLKVNSVNASIHVIAHSNPEVFVDIEERRGRTRTAPNGMKQILTGAASAGIEEERNIVTIKPHNSSGSFVIHVPEKSSVQIKSVNARDLRIEHIAGEINAESVNGSIVIVDAAGPVVAHALNGRLTATLKHIPPGKPMSFSTLNGRIDVTLPQAAAADLKIDNQRGNTYSDFGLNVQTTLSTTASGREDGPKYQLHLGRSVLARINGGGPEISMRCVNGTIYIRQAK